VPGDRSGYDHENVPLFADTCHDSAGDNDVAV
jgi:hypothetical protein